MSRDLQPAGFQIDYGTSAGGKNQWGPLDQSGTQGIGARSAFPTIAYQPNLNELNIFVQGTTATTQNTLSFAPSGTPNGLTQSFYYGAGTLVTTTTNNLLLLPSTNSRQPQSSITFDDRRLKGSTELKSSINGTGGAVAAMALATGTATVSFNGTSQFLSVTEATPGTTLSFGLGAFTIDGFFYRTSTSTTSTFAAKGLGQTGWTIYISAGNVVVYNDTSVTITGTTAIQNNTWYHVAVSRVSTGTSTALFVNGILQSTATSTANLNLTDVLRIGAGRTGQATNYWAGSISNFRMIKGTALYSTTTSFTFTNTAVTPVSMPVTAVSTSNTVLLACVATTGTNTATVFTSTSSNYLTIPYQAGYNIGASVPFSFECWAYTVSASAFYLAGRNNAVNTGTATWSFWLVNGVTPQMNIAGTGSALNVMGLSTLSGTLNRWNHYAFARDSANAFRIFVNGAVGVTRTDSQALTSASGDIYIGAPSTLGAYSTGYTSNMRFVVGNTVYTGAFTVPPIPFTTTTTAGTNINAITTETALLVLQRSDFRGNDRVSTATAYINNFNGVDSIQFVNTATAIVSQYADLSPLYGTFTTVASTITGNISPLVTTGTIAIVYTNTSAVMEVPLYNYPNTSRWAAGATIPYQYIGQTGNVSTLTNRTGNFVFQPGSYNQGVPATLVLGSAIPGSGKGTDPLIIEPSSQIFFKDGRFKPINNVNFLSGYGFAGNNVNYYLGIQDFDSGLLIPVLNSSTYQTVGVRAIPTGYMSYDRATITASLSINIDGSFYVGGPGSGAVGGSSAIFVTSAYVSPNAPLGPAQLVNRLRQVWTAN
jgi:hypothetical protein